MTEARNPNILRGFVDTFVLASDKRTNTNWPLPIYPVEKLLGDSTQEGETMRRVYFEPEEFYKVVFRPRVNDAPDEYYRIPDHLAAGLWMGDKIQVVVRHKPGLDGSPFCLGEVTKILTPPPSLRARWRNWLAARRTYQGPHQFCRDNEMIRILTLTHTMFGKGARVSIGAPAKTGKTTLLLKLVEAIQPGPKLIVVLSERPEENMMFKDLLGIKDDADGTPVWETDKCELFVAPASSGASTRMHNIMLAAKRAEGLAAQGEDVIFIVDSWTKALIDPVHSIAKDSGGTEEGGVNPYAKECITIMLGMAGNTARGSITVVGTFLNNGSKKDTTMMMHGRGEGNADVMLSQTLKKAGIYPAIDWDAFVMKTQGLGDIENTTTDDRFADQWMEQECPWLIKPSERLQVYMSLSTCEREIAEEESTKNRPAQRDQIKSRALREKWTRVRTFFDMIKRGAPNREIFARFKIDYFDPSENEVPIEEAEKTGLPVNDPRPAPETARTVIHLPASEAQMATTPAASRKLQQQIQTAAAKPPQRQPKPRPQIVRDTEANALLYGDDLPGRKAEEQVAEAPAATSADEAAEQARKEALAAFGVSEEELAEMRARDTVPIFAAPERPADVDAFTWALTLAQADVDSETVNLTPGREIAAAVDDLDDAFAQLLSQVEDTGETAQEPVEEAVVAPQDEPVLTLAIEEIAELDLTTLEPFSFPAEDAVAALLEPGEDLVETVETIVAAPVLDERDKLLMALLAMDQPAPDTSPLPRRHVPSGTAHRPIPPAPGNRIMRYVHRFISRIGLL